MEFKSYNYGSFDGAPCSRCSTGPYVRAVELGLPPASEARSDEEGGGQNLKVCLWSGTALDCHPDTVRARSALKGVLD